MQIVCLIGHSVMKFGLGLTPCKAVFVIIISDWVSGQTLLSSRIRKTNWCSHKIDSLLECCLVV